jgi:serine/threonine protein kinase
LQQDWRLCEQFIKKKAPAFFSKGITYIHAAPTHPYTIEQDPQTKTIYIHLRGAVNSYIGRGRFKRVTKSIVYDEHPEVVARCQGHSSTLAKEAKILVKLQGTPGIVQLQSFIKHKKRESELILKYYNSGPLQTLSSGRLKLTDKDLLSIMKDLTIGLKSLHAAGYIHRDLHQGNVLLHRKNGVLEAVITDFGLAYKIDEKPNSRISVQDSVCAPEALTTRLRNIDRKKAETYSLGVLFHYMIFNDRPAWWEVIRQYVPHTKAEKIQMHQTICALYQTMITNGPPSNLNGFRKDATLLAYKLLNPNPEKRIYLDTVLKSINAIAKKWHLEQKRPHHKKLPILPTPNGKFLDS